MKLVRPSWAIGIGMPTWIALGVLVVVGGVYLATTCRTVYWGDSGELIAAAWQLGIPHPTGYPLYALLGRLAALLPGGEVAWRLNLLSAVWGTIACMGVGGLVAREKPSPHPEAADAEASLRRTLCGAAAAALLAFSPLFWLESTIAEVYALNVCFVALILGSLHRWEQAGDVRWRYAAALLLGLSLANHVTMALLIPGLIIVAGARPGPAGRRGRVSVIQGLFCLAGLALYAYLPLRSSVDPARDWGNPETWRGFWWLVSAEEFQHLAFSAGWSGLVQKGITGLRLLFAQFGVPGVLLAGLGLFVGLRNQRRRTVGLAVMAVANVIYTINYDVPAGIDWSMYFLPTYWLCALWIGSGMEAAVRWVRPASGWASRALLGAFLLLPLAAVVQHYPEANKRPLRAAHRFAHDLAAHCPPNAIFLAESTYFSFGLTYLQEVEGQRPDVVNVYLSLLNYPWYVDYLRARYPDLRVPRWSAAIATELIEANRDDHPLYTDSARDRPLIDPAALQPWGLIFQVTDTPLTESQTRRSRELWTICDLQPQDPADEVTLEVFLERHLLLAKYYRERGAAEAVIRECQRSLDLARAHPQGPPPAKLLAQAHLWLGLIDRERNDLTAATQHYEQAVSLQPRNVELRNSLAVLYTQQGDLPRALAQWEAALRVDPDNPSLRRNRQRARAALGKDSAPP